MKKYFAIIILFSSCSVLKPKPAPTPQGKVPNIMSRSIPLAGVLEETARDSLFLIAKRLDTMAYNTHNTVKYQNKVIDTLWGRQNKYEATIKYQEVMIDSLKKVINKMQWIDFNENDFTVTIVNDTIVGVSLKPRSLPQPLGRSAAEPETLYASPSWLSKHSISNRND